MRRAIGERSAGEWASDLGFVAALGSTLFTPTLLCWLTPAAAAAAPEVWRHEALRLALTGPLGLMPRGVWSPFMELCALPTLWVALLAVGLRMGVDLPRRAWWLALAPPLAAVIGLGWLYAEVGAIGWAGAGWLVGVSGALIGAGVAAGRRSEAIEGAQGMLALVAALAAHLGAPLLLKFLLLMGRISL